MATLERVRKLLGYLDDQEKIPKRFAKLIKIGKEGGTRKIILRDKRGFISISKPLPPLQEIYSELVGTFKPRVKKGKKIRREGKTIGVIEHLRIQEKIKAGAKGIIEEIIEEGPVGYGSFLCSIQPQLRKMRKEKRKEKRRKI